MIDPETAPVYYELIVEAASQSTEIWLGDNEGHFVQKETGLLRSSLGVVVLKAISSPSMEEFEGLIAEAQKRARKAGLRSIDIRTAIAKVRARR